jgi:hypothetical protein
MSLLYSVLERVRLIASQGVSPTLPATLSTQLSNHPKELQPTVGRRWKLAAAIGVHQIARRLEATQNRLKQPWRSSSLCGSTDAAAAVICSRATRQPPPRAI